MVKTWQAKPDEETCPRCGSHDFTELDCGPDGWDDDITYISLQCNICGLWYDGWVDKWLVDCDSWQDSEDCQEYIGGEIDQWPQETRFSSSHHQWEKRQRRIVREKQSCGGRNRGGSI